ncbi:MAG: hypothetical protein FJZ61_05610 [Chlamydiae bacterium]|nr:hypothetical protein [Chlamydiota bacterium]
MQTATIKESPIDWIKKELAKVEATIKTDVEKAVQTVRSDIADYIDKNAQPLADKVTLLLEEAGSNVEAEIGKISDMVRQDVDTAVSTVVADVCKALGIDPDTAKKVETEVQAKIDNAIAGTTNKIEKALQNIVDGVAQKTDTSIAAILHDLAKKIRG